MPDLRLPALNHETGRLCQLTLPERVVKDVRNRAPAYKWFELIGDGHPSGRFSCVRQVLCNPAFIYSGNKRLEPVAGLCYCGIPTYRFTNGGSQCPPPPMMIFMVFVNGNSEVFDWSWEKAFADSHGRLIPENVNTRFEGRVWPSPSQTF